MEARRFAELYRRLRTPEVVVTSPLRRCLQTAMHAFGQLAIAGRIRIIAHPDLQEVSNRPCDTGTPLDLLRSEFPAVEFLDDVFPDAWPRSSDTMPDKEDTIYDNKPELLYARSVRIKKWMKELDAKEIVVVTHGSFAHFLFNDWSGTPGESISFGYQLGNGVARTLTMPDMTLAGIEFGAFVKGFGPNYPVTGIREDNQPRVYRFGKRDCGVFTDNSLR
jgi:broad specificity phosphatase PhoE